MIQSDRCQFGTCQSHGTERTIAFIEESNNRVIIRPTMCEKHHRAAMDVDGPQWNWIQTID
jgi:hypothetical protein